MTMRSYLQIDGVAGDSTDDGYAGWIECDSVGWSLRGGGPRAACRRSGSSRPGMWHRASWPGCASRPRRWRVHALNSSGPVRTAHGSSITGSSWSR
ncbi:hypothetical protein EWM63_28875 [Pseudoduganella lutea]|uniref:Type VI secretion system tube protein Hcp n=1 Tax=Pseudoduganella lutea TaxID=321985 RepID=A0A4P6L487_9BURK|nr:hypothetical protein EWM63_28875 [Pseudoduganella lutea]